MESQQHDPTVESILAKHELAEILVRRDQHATLSRRRLENVLVFDPRPLFSHIGDVVTCSSKCLDDWAVDALVA